MVKEDFRVLFLPSPMAMSFGSSPKIPDTSVPLDGVKSSVAQEDQRVDLLPPPPNTHQGQPAQEAWASLPSGTGSLDMLEPPGPSAYLHWEGVLRCRCVLVCDEGNP